MNTASIIFVLESWRTEVRIRERSPQRGLPNRNDRTPRLFPPRIAEERTCMPTQLPLARFQSCSTSSVTHGDDRTCCGELIRHGKTIAFSLEKKRSRKKKRSCILYIQNGHELMQDLYVQNVDHVTRLKQIALFRPPNDGRRCCKLWRMMDPRPKCKCSSPPYWSWHQEQ